MIRHRHLRPTPDQRGIALLLSLLLMAALTAASIAASTVIINEFRTTASTDAGIGAYYAADIGVERSLFTIFDNRLLGLNLGTEGGYSGVFMSVQTGYPDLTGATALLGNAKVSLADSRLNQDSKVADISKDQSVQLELFYQPDPFNPPTPPGVVRKLYLRAPGLASLTPEPWLEVQWSYVKKSSVNAGFQSNSTVRLVTAHDLDGAGVRIDLYSGDVSPVLGSPTTSIENPSGLTALDSLPNFSDIAGWNVRVKALYANVPNVTMVAKLQDDATIFPFANDIHLVSRGESGNARARLDATVPWHLPSSGLFDYVIFSENNLDKSGT